MRVGKGENALPLFSERKHQNFEKKTMRKGEAPALTKRGEKANRRKKKQFFTKMTKGKFKRLGLEGGYGVVQEKKVNTGKWRYQHAVKRTNAEKTQFDSHSRKQGVKESRNGIQKRGTSFRRGVESRTNHEEPSTLAATKEEKECPVALCFLKGGRTSGLPQGNKKRKIDKGEKGAQQVDQKKKKEPIWRARRKRRGEEKSLFSSP